MEQPIAIYTVTSPLHDEVAVNASTERFLGSLGIAFDNHGAGYTTYGTAPLSLLYVRTGGTEGVLRPQLPQLLSQSKQPIYLLTSGESNSLAASMEILSYLRQNNIKGEIIHGSAEYIRTRVRLLYKVQEARQRLQGMNLGIVGEPSDWLISSIYDKQVLKEKLGITLVDIPMQELLDEYSKVAEPEVPQELRNLGTEEIRKALPGALRIYEGLKNITKTYNLSGLTIRCFDLLSAVHNTGCIALARLNSEGYVAGCEGDVPTMLSMAVSRALTGVSGFQANPSRIDPEKGEILFAHCTIPLNMLQRYELDTHFESGIGVGIRGFMENGPVTILKVAGDLSRHFVAEAQLVRSQGEKNLCRTQQVLQLADPSEARYFLTNPIGNHHVIIPGHHAMEINALLQGNIS